MPRHPSQARWQAARKDIENAKAQGGALLLQELNARLQQTNTEAELRSGLQTTRDGIAALEKLQKQGPLNTKNADALKKLKVLLPQLQEGLALIAEVRAAKPTDDLAKLISLKDRVQAKLEAIQLLVKQQGTIDVAAGVLIEAEGESATRLLPRDVKWASTKEINPSWRPKPSGGADWYLSRGDETLTYFFQAPVAGLYYLWVRDLNDGNHPIQNRSITILVDGKRLGDFPSNDKPDAQWNWHKVTQVQLTADQHQMDVIKTATTSSAAQLDAFYFTTDPNDVPGTKPIASAGLLIEAENETQAIFAQKSPQVTRKELDLPAGFRPAPISGRGNWVLFAVGDKLVYRFTITMVGTYHLWVRDFSDSAHAAGARTVTIAIDGKTVGDVPENTARTTVWQWHKAATVPLQTGTHEMTVTKTAQTSAGALLDAFYFTQDPADVPNTQGSL
jgi:archaellum component FlaG (FlaF/FlaG flagellin family)